MIGADDRLQIVDVVHRWSHVADGDAPSLLDEVMTHDAVLDVAGEATDGLDAIGARLAAEVAVRQVQPRRHVRNTIFVSVDSDRVVTRSYYLLTGVASQGLAQALCTGVYEDEVVKTSQGWRIRRRVAFPDGEGALGLRA